jgi:hypothetical protein
LGAAEEPWARKDLQCRRRLERWNSATEKEPSFIGFKVDNQLREKPASLEDGNRKYISAEGSTFLRIYGVSEGLYVGKLVDDRLRTDQMEDIRCDVLSILRKVGHEIRLGTNPQILVCSSVDADRLPAGSSHLE